MYSITIHRQYNAGCEDVSMHRKLHACLFETKEAPTLSVVSIAYNYIQTDPVLHVQTLFSLQTA